MLAFDNVFVRSLVVAVVLTHAGVASAQSTTPSAPATSRPVQSSGYARELLWPAAPRAGGVEHPILLVGHDSGLISTGIVLLTLGMSVGVAYAINDATNGNCRAFTSGAGFAGLQPVECGSEPFALVPIAGPILVGAVHFRGELDDALPVVLGLVALVPQILGLVSLLMGVHGTTADVRPRSGVAGVDLSVAPFASRDAIGLSLRIDG